MAFIEIPHAYASDIAARHPARVIGGATTVNIQVPALPVFRSTDGL
jgi:hypothetical protein